MTAQSSLDVTAENPQGPPASESPRESPRRPFRGVWGVAIGLIALGAWAVYRNLLPGVRHDPLGNLFQWPVDYRVYRAAAEALRHGEDLYSRNFIGDLPFTYPPFAGTIMRVLGYSSMERMAIVWQSCSILVFLLVIIAVLRERGYRWSIGLPIIAILVFFASMNLGAIHGTIFYGQINIFLMGLVAIDFLCRSNRWWRGIGTGIAAGIKLTPAFNGILFLLERRWIAAIVSVLTFLATVVIGFIGVPDAMHYWTVSIFKTDRIGVQSNPGAESLQGVLHRTGVPQEKLVWILLVIVTFVVFCIAARGAIKHGNMSLAFSLSGITAAIVSPFSWFHHWVFLAPLAVVFIDAILRGTTAITDRFSAAPARWIVDQLGGLIAVALVTVVFLPYVSHVSYFPMSYFAQGDSDFWLFKGLYVYSAMAIILVVAIWYVVVDVVEKNSSRRSASTPAAESELAPEADVRSVGKDV